MMNGRERQSLDSYITGNYGEDQFDLDYNEELERQDDETLPDWVLRWIDAR